MRILPNHENTAGLSPERTAAIRTELSTILKSSYFSGSKRCQDFLEFIVQQALDGNYEYLTERFIGAELFGRPINYETGTDSIVRVRANDLRRRLTQYYSELSVPPCVTIELVSGNYVPDFHWPPQEPDIHPAQIPPFPPSDRLSRELDSSATRQPRTFFRRARIPIVIAAGILLLAGILTERLQRQSATPNFALEAFWQPMIQNGKPVIVCFPDNDMFWATPHLWRVLKERPQTIQLKPEDYILTKDDSASSGSIRAALNIVSLLNSHGVNTMLRWPQEAQEADLDRTNAIFIGLFSNPWALDVNENLRFSLKRIDANEDSTWKDEGSVWMILDRNSPGRSWSNTKTYPQPIDHEFALITRIIDPERKRVVMTVGGLNQMGSEVAAEFMTNRDSFGEFARKLPPGWEHRNLQIVMGMEVVGKKVVNPKVLDSYVW